MWMRTGLARNLHHAERTGIGWRADSGWSSRNDLPFSAGCHGATTLTGQFYRTSQESPQLPREPREPVVSISSRNAAHQPAAVSSGMPRRSLVLSLHPGEFILRVRSSGFKRPGGLVEQISPKLLPRLSLIMGAKRKSVQPTQRSRDLAKIMTIN
ncbi:hypothetical protein VTO42DRAFT_8243 [Malbranchea cinnamomea]